MCVTVILMLIFLRVSIKQELSSKDCENLGFTGLALCSDCKTLSGYVKDQVAAVVQVQVVDDPCENRRAVSKPNRASGDGAGAGAGQHFDICVLSFSFN
ncbi:hypothetical protein RND81_07G097500 [Saponaria officinalis]|uniref:Uncharacterized protein n=1 Tax=Saponaria officinalis TaxID=3572 RepID=A0AAW1JQ35_SAPOF